MKTLFLKTIHSFDLYLFSFFLFLTMPLTFAQTDKMSFQKRSSRMKWEFFHEEQGIKLFRAPENKDGIVPFRAQAKIKANYHDVLKVLVDIERRPDWSPKLKSVKIHDNERPGNFIFSEYYKTPWPFSDREFLMRGIIFFPEKDLITMYAKSINKEKFADDDHIQCDVHYLNVNLYRLGLTETGISISFSGDMKGWMPSWLINIIQKKWPLRLIEGLRRELKGRGARLTKYYEELGPIFPLR